MKTNRWLLPALLVLVLFTITACIPDTNGFVNPQTQENQTISLAPPDIQPDVFLPFVSGGQAQVSAASSLFLNAGEAATIQCVDGILAASGQTEFSIDLLCIAFTPTPTHTPTETPTPTDTPIPPTATPVVVATIAPFAAAPECATHDIRAFHTLWDAVNGCHYTHSHGENPHTMDDIFGTQIYAWAGGEISYPWQTFAGADATFKPMPDDPATWENGSKHEGYHWLTGRDLACYPQANTAVCIRAFRTQSHVLPHKVDALIRFHSFWAEALLCWGPEHATCGIIRSGGWQDFGKLAIDGVHYPLPNDAPNAASVNLRRDHRWSGGPFASNVNRDLVWYGAQPGGGFTSLAINFETLSVLEPNATLTEHFLCSAYGPDGGNPSACPVPYDRQNGSNFFQITLGYGLRDNADGVMDGKITLDGYADRHGKRNLSCASVGLDCVPLGVEGVPTTLPLVQFNIRGQHTEMDIVLPDTYWLKYPVHH